MDGRTARGAPRARALRWGVVLLVLAGCGSGVEPVVVQDSGNKPGDVPRPEDVTSGTDAAEGGTADREEAPGTDGGPDGGGGEGGVTDGGGMDLVMMMETCVPTPEVCDGVDNDCNGRVDDGLGRTTCGMGACERTVENCARGMMQTCTPGMPAMEICDRVDNDCNGMVDDGLGRTTCGMGACERTVDNCVEGSERTCMPGPPAPETCNGRDDDCNGRVDDGLGRTTCGMGACERTVDNCVEGMARTCTPGMPGMEVCDGVDNNCDGTIDEGLGMTTCGVGACQRTQANCVRGMPAMCMPGMPGMETCNGLDDDCNGMVDDGLGVASCGRGACARMVPRCVMGVPQTCVEGSPSAEICDGIDNNCDGRTDEDDPGGGETCATGLPGVCSIGVTHCRAGRVRCEARMMPSMETCDGMDNNCDGQVDNAPAAVLCPPPPGVSTTVCAPGGGCQIAPMGCGAGRFDVDGRYATGCECQDDMFGGSCMSPTNVGTLAPGAAAMTRDGRVPAVGGEDWFVVNFPPSFSSQMRGQGTPTIRLTMNEGTSYRFEVRASCGAGPLGCGPGGAMTASGLTEWTFTDNASAAGAGAFSTRNTAWPATVYVRVYRITPGLACSNYQLTVTR